MAEEGSSVTVKSIWNMDDARLRVLNDYLVFAEQAILSWSSEEAYIQLQGVDLVLYGVLSKNESDIINKKFEKIEKIRRQFNPENEKDSKKKQINIHGLQVNLYKQFNTYMVKHGLYFRKGADPGKAIEM